MASMSPVTPAAAEPRRSTRLLSKPEPPDAERSTSRGGKRRRKAAGKSTGARKRAAKAGKREEPEPAAMEVDDAGSGINGDMFPEEPDSESAEEQAEHGGEGSAETAGARKRVAPPRAQRRADHFVGEPIPDDKARRRWPDRYATKVSASHARRSNDPDEEIGARCHYTSACVDDAIFNLNDDVYVKVNHFC